VSDARGGRSPGARRARPPASAPVSFRRGRLADAPAVARVMSASIRGLAAGSYGPAQIAAWSSVPALYHAWAMTSGGERYLLAERRGRLVAYAARRGGELTALFVRPREARRGLGRALLRAVEQETLRAGLRRLRVVAALSALGFYEAAGFTGGVPVRAPLPGGASLEARLLEKRLGGAGVRPRPARRSPPRGAR
jgi:putative acetyltransferase